MVLIHVLISTFVHGLVVLYWIINNLETSIFFLNCPIFLLVFTKNFFHNWTKIHNNRFKSWVWWIKISGTSHIIIIVSSVTCRVPYIGPYPWLGWTINPIRIPCGGCITKTPSTQRLRSDQVEAQVEVNAQIMTFFDQFIVLLNLLKDLRISHPNSKPFT